MKCWREEGTLQKTSVPSRGSRNTLCRFITLGKWNKVKVDGAIFTLCVYAHRASAR